MAERVTSPVSVNTSLKYAVNLAVLGVVSVFLAVLSTALLEWASIPCMMLIMLISFALHGEFKGDFFKPIIPVVGFFAVFYIIAPIIIISKNAYHHPHFANETLLATKALFYVSLALFSLCVGYKSNIGRNLACHLPVLSKEWNIKRAIFLIIFFSFIGFAAYCLLVHLNGGFRTFIYYIHNRARLVQGKGFLKEAINLIGLALFASYILYRKGKKTIFRTFGLSTLTLSYFILSLTLGGRGHVINILITLMFIHNYIVKRVRLKTFLILLLILPFFVNYAGMIRGTAIESASQLWEVARKKKRSFTTMVSKDFGAIDTSMAIMEHVPSSVGHQWGKTYLKGFLGLVPRALYPDKPFGTAAEVHYWVYGERFHHTSALWAPQSASAITWIDELYINFAFIGVILGSFFRGVILRAYHMYLMSNVTNKSVIFVCAALFVHVISLSGDFFQNIIHFAPLAAATFIFYLFVRRKIR